MFAKIFVSYAYRWHVKKILKKKLYGPEKNKVCKLSLKLDAIVLLKKSTLFAFGEICSTIDELKGTHPLKTAPPPRVFGYNRTLAKVKAPAKELLIFANYQN